MYKVFINEKVVILTDCYDLELLQNGMLYFQYDDFEELHFVLTMLEDSNDLTGVIIQTNELDILWADFRAHFREIEAAGGLVTNDSNEILLIHRFGKWDLPKGKREKGESILTCAVREVQEECGLNDLKPGKQLRDTYHIYREKDSRILKRTYWFEMKSSTGQLVPQAEEGIEQAIWLASEKIDWTQMETYPNIRILIDSFLLPTDQS